MAGSLLYAQERKVTVTNHEVPSLFPTPYSNFVIKRMGCKKKQSVTGANQPMVADFSP
jgi:hypothetical protein